MAKKQLFYCYGCTNLENDFMAITFIVMSLVLTSKEIRIDQCATGFSSKAREPNFYLNHYLRSRSTHVCLHLVHEL